jgi:hypothetical protein
MAMSTTRGPSPRRICSCKPPGPARLPEAIPNSPHTGPHCERIVSVCSSAYGTTLEIEKLASFDHRLFFMLFNSTVRSCVSLRTPGSSFLEASLLVRKLEQTGETGLRIDQALTRINELTEQSWQTHMDILEDVMGLLLGGRADMTFTSADLAAVGVDDTPPSQLDYPSDFESF